MIESLRARWIIILLTLVVATIWVMPNFVKLGDGWWFSKEKIVYGLDIQGGLHLVMGVDTAAVIEEKMARLANSFQDELKERAVIFKSIDVDPSKKTEMIVGISSAEEAQAIKSFIEERYPATLQIIEESSTKVVLRYFDARILDYKKQVISQAIEVIRNRIDEFGVSEPSISSQGDERILVQLPGIKDANRAKELINRTAKLTFRGVSDKVKVAELNEMIAKAEVKGEYALGKNELRYSNYVKKINNDLKDKLPKNTKVVFEKADSAVNLEGGKNPFLIKLDSDLTGNLLEDASVRTDEFGKPEVVFSFSVEGRRRFADLTEKNAGGFLAIILDDVIQSAPSIKERIDSSSARITLGSGRNFQETQNEAQFIATALRAGALPASLEQLEERTVGPTLGADSIARGKKAGIVGAMLILLFMLGYYKKLGVVANIALSFNVLLILSILTSLGATLTLPGVAGIVLTVGMAVDANVIIFERIKEEIAKGVGLKSAINDGFGHAFSAIFDANITTAIVCVVLMYYGTGAVRGFAVTLLCGIITSMFTSIFVSRSIIDLMVVRFKVTKFV